jgi:hypothetical protein
MSRFIGRLARVLPSLFAAAIALACPGCGSSSSSQSTTATPPGATAESLAELAAHQRACIDALKLRLAALTVTRIDAFLSQTLSGLVVCDASYGLAYLPSREVRAWLENADGKPHAQVRVPDQPAEITTLPRDGAGRVRYQRHCIAWMRRYLPASIARNGDDPDVAAADVFNGIEECDAVAGLATISREQLAAWVKSKNLN